TERYAEGTASTEERSQVETALPIGSNELYLGVYLTSDPFRFACHCSGVSRVYAGWTALERDDPIEFQSLTTQNAMQQTELLRCIFGYLFRSTMLPSVCVASAATKIAEAIYTERTFDHPPVLADALHDAGCDDEDVLNHCRKTQGHDRGCWVLDWLTG